MKNKIVELGISEREADELIKVSYNIEEDYNKLLKKYPIQYLIGYVNFYGYKIYVNENTLIPRYETEYLVEKTIKYCKELFKDKRIKILDLCTGSGCIGISLEKNLNSIVDVSDISKEALEVANKNKIENNSSINIINSDLFNNIDDKYDVIISNPPYIGENEEIMESVKLYEPNIALFAGEDGLLIYKKIIDQIDKHLNNKFLIAFEIGYLQANSIKEIINNKFKNVKVIIEKDLSEKDRYLFVINE